MGNPIVIEYYKLDATRKMQRTVLFTLGLVMLFVAVVNSLSCLQCDENPDCPDPPTCSEYGRTPCGCCDVCKLGEGEECRSFTAECESALECVDPDGTSYGSRPFWWQFDVSGVCSIV